MFKSDIFIQKCNIVDKGPLSILIRLFIINIDGVENNMCT